MNPDDSSVLENAHLWRPQEDRDIILQNADVITMDTDLGDLRGDVHIRGGRIERVGEALDVPDGALTLDLSGKVVLPGLVDSHVHAWEGQLRGLAPEADFPEYSHIVHESFGPKMRPKDIAAGQWVTVAQAINGGITTLIDNSHNSRTPEHSDAAVSVLQESGIRAVHAVGAPQHGPGGDQLPGDVLRIRDGVPSGPEHLLTLRVFDASPTLQTWRFAAENGLGVVAEMGPWIPDLDALLDSNLVDATHTYNHCVGLQPSHWRRIADAGAAVNMAPRSDPQFGLGACAPILEANRYEIQEGISGDNELCYGLDMFTEMRTLLSVQRGLSLQAKASDPNAPRAYGPRDVLRAATVGGALNAGLPRLIGTVTPGKRADLVVMELNDVRCRPCGSTIAAVVSFAGLENVFGVLIDGVFKKWAGTLLAIDYDDVVAQAEESLAFLAADR